MRMTNEQFEAEVFRRSKVYLQQRQKRRRQYFTAAAAFAGCFMLAVLGARVLSLHNKMESVNMAADMAAENGDYTYGKQAEESSAADAEYAEESSEEYAEESEMADAEGGYDDANDDYAEESSEAPESAADEAPDAQGQQGQTQGGSPVKKDEGQTPLEALCAQFGIPVPPEEIAGFVRYDIDDLAADTDQCAFLYYENADGSRLTVEICTPSDSDPEEIRYDIIIVGGKSALFRAADARIIMWVNDDAPDADALIHEAAEVLKDELSR